MKLVLIILLLLIFNYTFSQSVINRSNSTITVNDARHMATLNSFQPNYADTTAANANIGIDTSGAIIHTYSPDAIWYRQSNPKKWVQMGAGANAINNGLISVGGITLVDSTVTILSNIVWSINGVVYTKTSNSSFVINSADSNYYRRDLIYADTSGLLYKIVGIEDTLIVVTPALPENSVVVTVVDIFGKHITSPTANIIGAIPNLQQTTDVGNTSTNRIILKYNNGGYAFQDSTNKNGYSGFGSINSNNGSSAASGNIAYNDIGHFMQWYQGSSTNAYAPDASLLRGSGTGGIKIAADSGKIIFQEGMLNTSYAQDTVGYFDTDKKFVLPHYKNNIAGDSVLTTDINGKIGMKIAGKGNDTAYVSIKQAPDSSYATFEHSNRALIPDTLEVSNISSGGITRFGIEDNLGIQNRIIDMQKLSTTINNSQSFNFNTSNAGSHQQGLLYIDSTYAGLFSQNYSATNQSGFIQIQGANSADSPMVQIVARNYSSLLKSKELNITAKRFMFIDVPNTTIANSNDTMILPHPGLSTSHFIPISVNKRFADSTGNIKSIDSTVTLTAGTITVSDTRVKTGARIFVSVNTPSGTQGFLSAKTSDIIDGTSFIINSTSATETSTVNYEIINP